MNPDKLAEIKEHVASCPKCRHAKRIGVLCPIGRKWLDAALCSLIPATSDTHNSLCSVASSK